MSDEGYVTARMATAFAILDGVLITLPMAAPRLHRYLSFTIGYHADGKPKTLEMWLPTRQITLEEYQRCLDVISAFETVFVREPAPLEQVELLPLENAARPVTFTNVKDATP